MTTTHEPLNQTAPQPLNEQERHLFTSERLEDWREHQKVFLSELRGDAANGQSVKQEFDARNQELLDEYLSAHGVEQDSPNYQEIRQLYLDAGIDNFSDSEWYASAAARGEQSGEPSGRDTFVGVFDDRLRQQVDAPNTDVDDNERQSDDDLEQLRADVAAARDKWSSVSAKRQGRLASIGIKDRKEIEADYQSKVNELIKRELADVLTDPNETDEFKNVAVIQHLFNEQELLRDQTKAKLQDTRINKFVKFMNKGNLPTRIAKGVTLGVGAGFLGTLLAGAAGAGVLAGGAVAASRFAKGYAVHSRDVGTKTFEEVADSERLNDYSADAQADEEARVEKLGGYFNESFDDDTKNEQRKRRKAFAWGAGSVAVGAALGYAIADFDNLKAKVSTLDERFGDWWNEKGINNPDGTGRPDGIPSAEDHDGDGILNGLDDDYDKRTDGGLPHAGDLNQNDIPDVDEPGKITEPDGGADKPEKPEKLDMVGDTGNNPDVVTVEYGHGYTHELMDLAEANGQHLSPEQAFELHKDLVDEFGPDYIDIDGPGNDIYHQYGDIRLSEPGVGRWEDGVPEFTAKWMDDRGLWSRT